MIERQVRLNPAFSFTCEDCGRLNFATATAVEDPDIQAQGVAQFRQILSITEGEAAAEDWTGEIMMAPSRVTCTHCNGIFGVESDDLGDIAMMVDDSDDDDGEWDDGDDEWGDDPGWETDDEEIDEDSDEEGPF